jgi:hypothetical protein
MGTQAAGAIVPCKMTKIVSKLRLEKIRVETPIQTDFVHNVVSGGTRSTTLGVGTQTRNNSPTYMLY